MSVRAKILTVNSADKLKLLYRKLNHDVKSHLRNVLAYNVHGHDASHVQDLLTSTM